LTCDPVVEGVHFTADAPAPAVGRKAVARNLSDLAAMGAVPDYLLVSLLVPDGCPPARRRGVLAGIRSAARAARCTVVGGDLGRTPGPLTVTVTAIGHLDGGVLLRTGARVGDRLHVTGPLGGASLGRHLRIRARLAEGRWLARQAGVGAALDVSDGLLLDLATLLEASGVPGAILEAGAVPIHADARRLARTTGRTPLAHALADGEDHELLFTVRAGTRLPAGGPLAAVARRTIGELASRRGLWLRTADGRLARLGAEGWHPDV